MATRLPISRRRFIKTGLLFVPTVFSAGLHGAVRLASLEPEVNSWMGRVVTNAGHYTSLSVVANDMAMKIARPIASKILRWNNYVGGDLGACAVPLINSSGSTVDTLQNFAAGNYAQATGLTGDGATMYAITGFVPSTHWSSDNDCSIGVYIRNNNSDVGTNMGVYFSTSANLLLQVSYGGTTTYGTMFSSVSPSNYLAGADTNGIGHYLTSRTSTISLTMYKNGVDPYGTVVPAGSKTSMNIGIYVHAYNNNTISMPSAYSSRTYGGYQICSGLSASNATILYSAVQAANRVCARQV